MGRIPRRRFLLTSAAALAAPSLTSLAQTPRHARIGYLSSGSAKNMFWPPLLLDSLRAVGWVEGRNLEFLARFAEGKPERVLELASELVKLKADVIVAPISPDVQAARRATTSIPIVTLSMVDPVKAGLAQSLARPGGNVTGILYADPTFNERAIQLFKEAVPSIRRLGIVHQAGLGSLEPYVEATESAARAIGITPYRFPMLRPEDVDATLASIKKQAIDALRVSYIGAIVAAEMQLLQFAAENKIPDLHNFAGPVERGGFMSYAPRFADSASRGAAIIDRILKGAKPAELPFEYPTRTDLVLNLRTAKERGIAVTQSIVLRADRVIE